mgnify:CR=1 FL=1
MSTDTGSGKTMGEEAGNRWEEWRETVACLENLVEKEAWASTTHAHSAYPCTACAVERAQGCRSIWEHPTVHTYDPWGLGSGQSERRTQIARAAGGYHTETNIRWKPVKTTRKRCFEVSKKCGMLRGWCFIATQNFKLKHITRCELWKRQNQCWIVPNSNVTIQGGICLFHSSHLVMFFNLKFCVAIKHHLLNIPHFFQIFMKL